MKPIFTFPPPRRRLNNLSTQNPKNLSRQTEPPHSGILLRIDISDVERECRGCSPGQSDPFWMTLAEGGPIFSVWLSASFRSAGRIESFVGKRGPAGWAIRPEFAILTRIGSRDAIW